MRLAPTLAIVIEGDWRDLLPGRVIRRATGRIFHYTDPAGLLGIIERRELWATEATGMNDITEVRQGWEFVRHWVRNQTHDVVTSAIAVACEDGHPANDVEGVFICCATTQEDDANQWRLYAHEGRGYCVELDGSVPLTAMGRESKRPGAPRPPSGSSATKAFLRLGESAVVSPWLHALYTEKAKTDALDGLVANARAEWRRREERGFADSEASEFALQELRDRVMTDTARIAQLMKPNAFTGEREVRAIVTAFLDSSSRFRATANGVVRYVRLTAAPQGHRVDALVFDDELGKRKSLPVRSVSLGPLIEAQNNERTIDALLRRNDFEGATVHRSAVHLRR